MKLPALMTTMGFAGELKRKATFIWQSESNRQVSLAFVPLNVGVSLNFLKASFIELLQPDSEAHMLIAVGHPHEPLPSGY